jgi:SAM-dependent methyltransferase
MQSDTLPSSPSMRSDPFLNGVTVVVTTFNDELFLSQALTSVLTQRHPAAEIIVVDDGSETTPVSILNDFPGVILIAKTNGGLASARNAGLRAARSRYICFLDADDLLTPDALASGLNCYGQHPEAAMVYGAHHRIRADGSPVGSLNYRPMGNDAYADMLTGNIIGMHATVLYRRDMLLEIGGYDEQLRRCEDYDLYLRITRDHPIASHPSITAKYRWHGRNLSRNKQQMLQTVLHVHEQHRPEPGARLEAWIEGQRNWKDWYTSGQDDGWGNPEPDELRFDPLRFLKSAARRVKSGLLGIVAERVPARFGKRWPPRLGRIDFGSFSSTVPASQDFGWDRGTPIDRYYVENFLAKNAGDIQGRVLEIGDDAYSKQFGADKISQQDVLHVDAQHPTATLKGSLIKPGVVPEDAFDCIVFTQTLQVIFELDEAVERLHAALKPGGVLLLTVPGISQIDRQEWCESWCWAFTVTSVRRLFAKHFNANDLEITAYGNVFAASSFLFGVALEEIDSKKLDEVDPAYPCIISLRASRRA